MQMKARLLVSILILVRGFAEAGEGDILLSGERKLNNLVSELLEVSSISKTSKPFTFTRSREGWIFISATFQGKGTAAVILNEESGGEVLMVHDAGSGRIGEAMRFVRKGSHTIQVECT